MSSKFQTALLIGITFVVVMLYMRRPEKQIPIVQDIQVTQPENKSITVSSEGVVTTIPDTVEFQIIIDTEDKELAIAREKNSELTQAAMTILKENEIPEEDIDTDFLRVRVDRTSNRIYRYIINNLIKVTIHDLDRLEPLLTALQQNGDIQISQITFSVSQMSRIEEQALQLAIGAAQEKAKAITRTMGLEIGKVITVQQLSSPYSSTRSYSTYDVTGLDAGYIYDNLTAVRFTEVEVTVQVSVTFELK